MIKKFLTVLFFVLITCPAYSAGGDGGSGGGDSKEKPVTQYQIAEKMIKKAKKFEKKNKTDKAQKHYKKAIGYLLKHNKKFPADPDTLKLFRISRIEKLVITKTQKYIIQWDLN